MTESKKIKEKDTLPIQSSSDTLQKKDLRIGKKSIQFVAKKGQAFDTCSAKGDDYICCNVKVLKTVSNCPYECSYCFLQDYLSNTQLQVTKDIPALVKEVTDYLEKNPHAFIRVGTWELGDSLALENQTGQAGKLIKEFAKIPRAILELKTKSDCVDRILPLNHKGKTVVSWSMNSEEICQKEEYKTASLTKRLTAAKRCQEAGYKIGLHFEPLMLYQNWQQGYNNMIDAIFAEIRPETIAWISMGSLRFNPKMRLSMQSLYPKSKALENEMVTGPDGKMRYLKPLRKELYTHIYKKLCRTLQVAHLGPHHAQSPSQPMLYLCMERWDMFEHVFGSSPESTEELENLFTQSLFNRFPDLNTNQSNNQN
ncbi:MAG: hypothetical protein VW378_00465 [bacterium]